MTPLSTLRPSKGKWQIQIKLRLRRVHGPSFRASWREELATLVLTWPPCVKAICRWKGHKTLTTPETSIFACAIVAMNKSMHWKINEIFDHYHFL